MTDEESCKIDQVLIALATSEEANQARDDKLDAVIVEVKALSRAVDAYMRETHELHRKYEYVARLLRLAANDRIRDTIPSPAPAPDEERTNPGNGG